jgi:hypothetical protein
MQPNSQPLDSPAPSRRARIIAFYLPQFHPIPENDAWWGKGFTEWTNVTAARPLFPGHVQPKRPTVLGMYDLREPEVRWAQAELARAHGVEGFCYWHYWFAGRRLLEKPFQEVLQTGEPNFPFCLGWANESWTGAWKNQPSKILLEQTYPGTADARAHFDFLLSAFSDNRYIKVDGKPLLYIYRPLKIPNSRELFEKWRDWAIYEGFPGLFIVGKNIFDFRDGMARGLDGVVMEPLGVRFSAHRTLDLAGRWIWGIRNRLHFGGPRVVSYQSIIHHLRPTLDHANIECFPCVYPNWDNTPRVGRRGLVLSNPTPESFSEHLEDAIHCVEGRTAQHRLVFLKSWNEWGEGNYVEPDSEHGEAYLKKIDMISIDRSTGP